MKAITISTYGGPEVLTVTELPDPVPAADEVLIAVRAFGLNHAEAYMRSGVFGEVAKVTGIECAGTVVADPSGRLAEGAAVVAILGGMGRARNGSYAELVTVPASSVVQVSTSLPWTDLVALPEVYATAWAGLRQNLGLRQGQTVLIRGATSALGQAAVNIAAEQGATVIATTRRPDRTTLLERIGAKIVLIDDGRLADQQAGVVDCVFDLVGNSVLRDSLRIVRPRGRVCQLGFLGGLEPVADFNPIADLPSGVQFSFYGSAFVLGTSAFPLTEIPLTEMIGKAETGLYQAKPARVFGFDEIVEAHRVMESGLAGRQDDRVGTLTLTEPAMTNDLRLLPEPGWHPALRDPTRQHGTCSVKAVRRRTRRREVVMRGWVLRRAPGGLACGWRGSCDGCGSGRVRASSTDAPSLLLGRRRCSIGVVSGGGRRRPGRGGRGWAGRVRLTGVGGRARGRPPAPLYAQAHLSHRTSCATEPHQLLLSPQRRQILHPTSGHRGAQGIGRGVAERVAGEGASVVLLDVDDDALRDAVAAFTAAGWPVAGVLGDVSRREDIRSAVSRAEDVFGGLDVLVAVAGIVEIKPFLDVTDASWRRILDVNLYGMFAAAQESARAMTRRGGGAIVLMASTNAFYPEASTVPYSVSKAGIIGLTRSAALDLAPLGIRVNAISPGQIVTRLSAVLVDDPVDGAAMLRSIPLGRWGKVSDIAAVAAFLACDDSAYMTGENVTVDAGLSVGTAMEIDGIELGQHGAARHAGPDQASAAGQAAR